MTDNGLMAVLLPVALFSIMLGLGLNLRAYHFAALLRQPGRLAVGAVGQLLILPMLALLVVTVASLPPAMAVGLMILSFAPGGATSNMITHLCRGDTAFSVALTTLTSLIIPFTLPLLTLLALEHWLGQQQSLVFPVLPAIIKLMLVTILPVVVGIWLNSRFPAACSRLKGVVKGASLSFLLIVVIGLTVSGWAQIGGHLPLLLPACLGLAVAAMVVGYLVARIAGYGRELKLTLAVEIGIQNAGTALLVTAGILHNTDMTISALTYGVVMQLPALLLIVGCNLPGGLWKHRSLAQ